jgi:hypothetical protein
MDQVKAWLFCLAVMVLGTGCANQQLTPIFRPVDIGFADAPRSYGDDKASALNSVKLPDLINKGSISLDDAFRSFRSRCAAGDACRFERNSIQDRLIAASNSICVEYKSSLKQAQANTNLNFGGASTIFGGLGALSKAANPARLYSGAAAMASGLRAEVNQNIYAMLAVEVITKAIDKTRTEALRDIDANQARVVTNYTLERAIADVEEYHGRCTVLAGLQEAATAVSQSENVGIKTLGQTLADLGQTTTLQLGKKQYSIGGADTILMKNVCTTAKQQYEAFIRDKSIDVAKADFKGEDQGWTNLFNDGNYCKDITATSGGVASEFDKRWQVLVVEFTGQTDEKERERIIGQIAGQQAGARAVAGTLNAALETVKSNMQVAQGRLDAVVAVVNKMKGVTQVPILTATPTEVELGDARKGLIQVQMAVKDAADKIRLTKSDLTTAQKASVSALIASVDSIKTNADGDSIKAAIALQAAAISAIGEWVQQ